MYEYMKISVVINTYNEEKNIERCLKSVKDFADEIVVVDQHSIDETVKIAKKLGAKVFQHKHTVYVEPARNFALSKATGDWIFLIDADEEIPSSLAKKLREVAEKNSVDVVEIPRKNIIFNKWIEHSRWWPDYLIRFFRKGKVEFSNTIHEPPKTSGVKIQLEPLEENAIIHYNFQTISQFVSRLNRYTDIQSEELVKKDCSFDWKDLVFKPSNEFFSRFFAGAGYKDGLHGLVLASLQAFSEFVVYLKVWEKRGFEEQNINDIKKVSLKAIGDYLFWLQKITLNSLDRLRLKIKAKI